MTSHSSKPPSRHSSRAPSDSRAKTRPRERETASGVSAAAVTPCRPPVFQGMALLPGSLFALIAAALVLRLVFLTREGYWADEIWVYNDCLRPYRDQLRTVHVPHFVIGRFFLSLWDSVGSLRLMSALWGVAALPFFHDAARRLLTRQSAWLATAFVAFSSYHVNYSLDANYYAAVIFFAVLALWLGIRYYENSHPLDLFLCVPALGLGFLFHPFAGIHLASLAMILFALALFNGSRRTWFWPPRWWAARREGMAFLIAAIWILAFLGVTIGFLPRAKSIVRMSIAAFDFGSTPRNYVFVPDLLYDYFRGNLTDYPLSSRLAISLAWPATVLLGVGAAASIRKRPWIAAFLLLPVAMSFLAICNLKAQHHFYIRYFSYCFPGLVILLAWGCEQLAAWARSSEDASLGKRESAPSIHLLEANRWGAISVVSVYIAGIALALILKWDTPTAPMCIALALGLLAFLAVAFPRLLPATTKRSTLAAILFGGIICVNAWTVTHRFLIRKGGNLNDAMAALDEQAKPGELLLYEYFPEWDMMQYYLPRIGFPLRDAMQLAAGDPAAEVRAAQVRALARINPSFWLIRIWNVDSRPLEVAWAEKHLDFTVNAPSNFEPLMDVKLFHSTLAGRYLDFPYGVRLDYRESERVPGSGNGKSGESQWERVVDVEVPTTVALRIVNAAALGEGARVRPSVDGDAVGEWMPADAVSVPIAVPAGKHKLGVGVKPGNDSSASAVTPPVALWSSLDLPGGIEFPATRVSLPFPTFCEQSVFQGRPVLRLIRNLGVQYWFQFPAAGTYEFRIEAVHDKPRPVWLDVAVDGAFQGIVAFDRLDNTWGEKAMPVQVDSAGWHSIAVNLVSAGEAAWNLKEDEETNAILGTLSLRRATGDAPARDERSGPRDGRLPKTTKIPVVDASGSKALPDWTIEGAPGGVTIVATRPIALRPDPAVEIEIPAASPGMILVGPPMPCRPGVTAIHAAAVLGTFDLINHSVSVGLRFFNSAGQLLQGTVPIGQEGIFRTTDGHRFDMVRPVPPGAARCALVVTVYANGARPAKTPGWIRVGDVAVGEH